MENRRRLADGIEPIEIIDLTVDVEQPVEAASGVLLRFTCPICYQIFEDPVATMCGHVFCKACLNLCLSRAAVCPLCKQDVWNTLRIFF